MKKDGTFYFLISFLVLVDLLIFGAVLYIFYKLDSTIIGSIIGFFGSIIGGFVTLLGVNRTIESGNKKAYYSGLLVQHTATIKTIKMFANMAGGFWSDDFEHTPYREAIEDIRGALGGTNGIVDLAANASEYVFEAIDNFDQYIESEYGFLLTDTFEKREAIAYRDTSTKINKCMEQLVEERKRLRREIQRNHPK